MMDATSDEVDEMDQGFNIERFVGHIDENFLCPICLNVLNKPVMCGHENQHYFCRSCIVTYLANSRTCPSCRSELTVDRLWDVPKVLRNVLGNLGIRCDYAERGCIGFVKLASLGSHVRECAFAPVSCTNQGCDAVLNKYDQLAHETQLCEFRKPECHDCSILKQETHESARNIQEKLHGIRNDLVALKGVCIEHMAAMRQAHGFVLEQVQNILSQLVNPGSMAVATDSSWNSLSRQDIIVVGGSREGGYVSAEMFRWSDMSWTPLKSLTYTREGSSAVVYKGHAIVIGGGEGSSGASAVTMESLLLGRIATATTAEQWSLYPTKLPRDLKHAAHVLHRNRLITIGGWDVRSKSCSWDISQVSMLPPAAISMIPPTVSMSTDHTMLPPTVSMSTDHTMLSPTAVSMSTDHTMLPPTISMSSDSVLSLTEGGVLAQMPDTRFHHGAVIVGDKIFIFGGRGNFRAWKTHASVLCFDLARNTRHEVAPLPHPLTEMATVARGNDVFLIGGKNGEGEVLKSVIKYNVATGESVIFAAEMKEARAGCCAITTDDVIVVMGGYGRERLGLNSVECFHVNEATWLQLPSMLYHRRWPTAAVVGH